MENKKDNLLILKEIKLHLGIKKDVDFAKFLNIPQSTLASWIKRNSIDFELIIEKCPDIDANWLLTGKGSITKQNYSNSLALEPSGTYATKADKNIGIQQIPLYSLEASAGIVKLFRDHQETKEFITIPNLPRCDGAIYINGDSMYPLLKSGDIVMYRQIQDISSCIFVWGEMYLISFQSDGDDYSTVKYLQKSELGADYIKLVSQNTHHQPIDILKASITALAIVKASVRINAMS